MQIDEQAVFPVSQLVDAKLHLKHAIVILNNELIKGGDGDVSLEAMERSAEIVYELYSLVRRMNNIIKIVSTP